MHNLLLSILVVTLILGGTIAPFILVQVLNRILGGLKVKALKSDAGTLRLLVNWDHSSFPIKVNRIKVDYNEIFRGGRAESFSMTFSDSNAKKKGFLAQFKITEDDYKMLTDFGTMNDQRSLKKSFISVEVETTENETKRFKFRKDKFLKAILGDNKIDEEKILSEVEILEPTEKDNWSLLTRVFEWRTPPVDEVDEDEAATGTDAAAAGPVEVDFSVTKVWIEPGCIVCDACENEAPAVFWVQEETCIVRDNAPLTDASSIALAAESCPVDVIKFDKGPKVA